jgi:bifunctional DNA-binding transcriptional regulator/antitoxin component of YhaV-PrlF toxin-antitoxin module
MADTSTIKLAQRGVVTLPKSLRDAYGLEAGDLLTLLDLGGVFVLSPQSAEIDALADRITKTLEASGESLESMLQVLREERENYET